MATGNRNGHEYEALSAMIQLDCGVVVPLAAYALACDLERRGCQLVVDGDDVLVSPPGLTSEDDRHRIRRHRAHLKTIVIAADSRVPEPIEFERVSDTLIVPLPAWRVVLAIEHAGHRITVDGADIVIEPGVGLDVHLLAELKRWKPHAIMLLSYTADDSHLRQPHAPNTRASESS